MGQLKAQVGDMKGAVSPNRVEKEKQIPTVEHDVPDVEADAEGTFLSNIDVNIVCRS